MKKTNNLSLNLFEGTDKLSIARSLAAVGAAAQITMVEIA